MIRSFLVSLILFLVLDWLWFTVFMKKFALEQLRPILKLNADGSMNANMVAAAGAYLCMTIIVTLFLESKLTGPFFWQGFFYSAAMGFLVFAIFDFTNLALFKSYPVSFVITDILWGTFLFSVVGFCLKLSKQVA